MASPPYSSATSPVNPSALALPRQRPSLALPSAASSRKSSLTSHHSAHPLRQTSFPPQDSLEVQHDELIARQSEAQRRRTQFSPETDASIGDFSDSEITSAISGALGEDGTAGKKRKRERGEKRGRGRPPKAAAESRVGSASLANGDDARSRKTVGAPSIVTGDAEGGEEDEEEDDEGGRQAEEGFIMDAAEMDRDKQRRTLFRETIPPSHQQRYDQYYKVKLRTQDIRRLVNATLSQSVPQNVTTVVSAYTKMFAGMLIEQAREVQSEWTAVAPQRPDGEENQAYKRLKLTRPTEPQTEGPVRAGGGQEVDVGNGSGIHIDGDKSGADRLGDPPLSGRPDGPANRMQDTNVSGQHRSKSGAASPNAEVDDEGMATIQPGAWGVSTVMDEADRGPLLADHLREALRRYRRSRAGGSVGFTGLSLEGREVAAPRMGGRRIFR